VDRDAILQAEEMTVPAAISAFPVTCSRLTCYRSKESWAEGGKQVNEDAESLQLSSPVVPLGSIMLH